MANILNGMCGIPHVVCIFNIIKKKKNRKGKELRQYYEHTYTVPLYYIRIDDGQFR